MMIQESFEMSKTRNKERNEKRKGNFEKFLTEAVENVFSSLGEPSKQAIYLHLKNNYNIGKEEIPQKIEDFADALEEIFGSGAKLIEIEIMKSLFCKVQSFKYSPKQESLLFADYLKKLGVF
jgi:nucleoside-diphosphate-sugar epimerase